MNSSRIAAALVIAFIVYITLRGELTQYFTLLFGPSKTDSTPLKESVANNQPGNLFGGLFSGFGDLFGSSEQATEVTSSIVFDTLA